VNPCTALNCVSNNDNGVAACAINANRAVAEWFAQANTTYFIRVHGRSGAVGQFNLTLTAAGTPTASTCTVCDLTAQPGDVLEVEACGASTNGTCNLAGVQSLPLASVVFGNTFSHDGGRTFDIYRFNLPAASYTFNLIFNAEHPTLFQVLNFANNTTCATSGGQLTGWQINDLPCGLPTTVDGPALAITAQANPAVFVRVIPGNGDVGGALNDFFGMPCNTGWNDYRFSISTNTAGACCIAGVCNAGFTRAECAFLAGNYQGDGTTCTPDPCGAVLTGACCTGVAPAGRTCSVLTADACTTAGGSYQGDGTTCAGVGYTNDVTTNNPAPPVNPNAPFDAQPGCCRANINGTGGVTVQDIFEFLSAWNAAIGGNASLIPLIDLNLSGVADVQDIFEFLTIWNAGCPPLP
jgi:hypothetical protein